ncbi:MAG TPA: class I SAM-dependent methyltransferase [Bacillota bacterium]|nr:class I SAM-dependent methyltransferase [Bacillota bacterium]
MASINENLNLWSGYDWTQLGDEWSEPWGGSDYLWFGTIMPRICRFLPAKTILEIAPGYGRCTQFLRFNCEKLIVVDVTPNCIDFCKERFKTATNIDYYVNDGRSLNMLDNHSIDFVFSWDSLVHTEADVISSYLCYLAAKLKPGGAGFLHHSNFGTLINPETSLPTVDNNHGRASSMTAELSRILCKNAGLRCIAQEIINWRESFLNDCFTWIQKPDKSQPVQETKIYSNPNFNLEMNHLQQISLLLS